MYFSGRLQLQPCILQAVSDAISKLTPKCPISVYSLKARLYARRPYATNLWNPYTTIWRDEDITILADVLFECGSALIIIPDNSTTGFTFSDQIRTAWGSNETGPGLRNLAQLHVNYTPPTETLPDGHYYFSAYSPRPLLILSHHDGKQYGDWKGGAKAGDKHTLKPATPTPVHLGSDSNTAMTDIPVNPTPIKNNIFAVFNNVVKGIAAAGDIIAAVRSAATTAVGGAATTAAVSLAAPQNKSAAGVALVRALVEKNITDYPLNTVETGKRRRQSATPVQSKRNKSQPTSFAGQTTSIKDRIGRV